MTWLRALISGLAVLNAVLVPQVAAQCQATASRFQSKMGSGFKSSLLMSGLRSPRHIVVDSKGNLLVAEQQGGGIRHLTITESGDSVCVGASKNLVTGGVTNHGVSLSADGKTLFVSNLQSVTAYDYDAEAATVGTGKVIVTGLANNGPHPTRAILASKSSPDMLLVARGSNANVDTATTSQTAGRCMIKAFSISQAMSSPANYNSDGYVLGWGLRNIVGMGEDPVYGGVWSVENSMDDIRLGGKDVHNENPAEKMNYHGVLNDTSNKYKGANFGYPSCVAAWDTGLLGNNLKVGDLFSPDSVPKTIDCGTSQQARIHFPSHTAPLDIKFTADASAAYVSFHGSWDRQPPDGYRVMKVEFKDGQPVAAVDSKTAGIPVMENTNNGACPRSCFRPVGLDFDSKGRLYMSSDASGEVYVITGA